MLIQKVKPSNPTFPTHGANGKLLAMIKPTGLTSSGFFLFRFIHFGEIHMSLETINKRTPRNNTPYIAGIQGKKVGLYAESLYAAKQKAVEHFRPSKKTMGLLWVELASEG